MEQVAGSRRQPYWSLRQRTVKERANKSTRGSAAVSGHVLLLPSPVGHSPERCWPGSPRTAQHEDSGDRGLRRDDRASLGTATCTAVAAVGMTGHVTSSQLVSCPGTIRAARAGSWGPSPAAPPPLTLLSLSWAIVPPVPGSTGTPLPAPCTSLQCHPSQIHVSSSPPAAWTAYTVEPWPLLLFALNLRLC